MKVKIFKFDDAKKGEEEMNAFLTEKVRVMHVTQSSITGAGHFPTTVVVTVFYDPLGGPFPPTPR